MSKKVSDFKLEGLAGLYIRLNKDATVYSKIDGSTPTLWAGWQPYKAGAVVGRLHKIIDSKQFSNVARGLWGMFYTSQGYAYYILIEPQTIDWQHINTQIDEKKKYTMAWYERIWEDFETSLTNYYNDAIAPTLTWVVVGAVVVGAGYLYFNTVGKYQIYQKIAVDAAKQFKNG